MRDWSARSDSNNNQRTRSWSALWRRLAGAIVPVAASAMVIGACAVHAEGSRSLFPAGYPAAGFRAAMDVRTGNTYASVVAGNQFLYVYAKAGEFILVGSSNRANGGDIFVYNPQSFGTPGVETIPGTAAYTCSAAAPVGSFGGGTRGQLTSRNNELAGPNSANNTVTVTNGFSPCAYLAPSDGVYGVRFTGATAGGSNTPDGIVATPQVLTSQIAAWDVVVRANATSTADINGRLFTYAWIGFTGNNPRPVYHTLYYVSTDGYRYRQDMRGIDPNAYALWANRAAFVDNGSPLYKDIRGSSQYVPTPLPAGTGINPQNAQYPIFFSDIGSAGPNATEATRVLQVLGIPDVPAVPTLTSGSFVGNVSGSTSTVGAGGTFQFDTTNTLSYQIVISRNGIDFDPATTTNRVLTGVALTGTHYVLWDGLDNAGAAFPSGTTYSYRMTGRNGEIHFPMIDAESNATGGPTLTKLNGSLDSKVFYDDRGYKTSNGTAVGVLNGLLCGAGNLQVPPVLDHSLLGVDSSVLTAGKYYRYWSGTVNSNADCVSTAANDFGDGKGLDLWAFQLTADIIGTVTIVPVSTSVDVGTSVAVDATAFPGNIVYGSFVFGNYGSANATGVTYAATIGTAGNCPASVTFTLVPAGVTAVYNAGTCAITFTGLPATLGGGQTRGFNFNYPAPNPGTVPVHTTITATNESVGATAPNSANGLTTIVISDLTISKAHVGNFRQGQIGATYTLTATNSGTGATAGTVTVTDTLPIGLTATAISGSGWACTLSPLACTRADSLAAGASYPVITVTVDVAANAAASLTNTATVAGGSEANTGNDSATDPTTVTASQLTVTKTASPTPFLVGQAASYSIVVQNTGNATTIGNITVTDNLPAGITLGSASGTNWSCTGTTALSCTFTGTLAASASTTLTLNVVVGVGAANGNNSATASGGGDSTCPLASHCSDTVTVAVVSAADLAIIKTGPANATAGQNVSYTLAVTNNGPSPATSVSLADPTPAGLGFVSASAPCAGGFPCALGTLANGATTNVTVVFSVPASYAGASIINIATVSSPTADPTPGNNSSTVTTPTAASADVQVVKTGPANATAGQNVSYTLAVTNNGPSNAQAVSLADPTPAGLTFVSASAPCAGGFPCALGTLANGATTNVTVVFSVPASYAGASIINIATVSSPTADPTPGNNSSTVTTPTAASADVQVVKTGPANATAGQNVSYTLAVTNNGPSNAQAVSLADPTPAGLTFVSAGAPCAGGFPCALGTLANGATTNVTVVFSVPASYAGASIINIATVSSPTADPTPGNNSSTVTTPVVLGADIEAVKTGPASVGFGGALSFTVVVTNHGPSSANGTTFSDAVPAAITSVTASCGLPTPGATCGLVNVAGNNVTSTITSLPLNGSVTFTISGTAPTSGASVTNNATAQPPAGTTDPTPGNNTGTWMTNLLPPQLTVTKSASPTPFVVGQPALYTITVQNTGSGTTNAPITIADNLPTGITLATATGTNWVCAGTSNLSCTFSGTLAPGAIATLTLNVNVAASATTANNTATASGGGDPTCSNCIGTVVVGVVASADIAVAKVVNNAIPNVGENVTFTITATNNGPSNATGVAITDALPSGLAFVSALPSQGSYVSATGLWTVGALANGANATLQITATVLLPGSLTNTATKTAGDQLDPNTSNNAASAGINAQPSADLQVLKTVNNAVPNLGTNVIFTITVTNAGPNDATGVVISDALPLGLNYVSSVASQGSYNDTTGLWTIGAIAQGASKTLTITATATLPGDVMNNASVSASDQHDPNPANNSSGATVNGQSADIQVIKTVDNNNPVRGDTVTFTITTTNNGPSNATGVAVTDVLPAGLAFVSATPSQGTFASGTGVWAIGNLAATGPGATVTLTIVATVNTDGGFTNTAAVSAADQPDPNTANNSSSVVVTPIASADVEVVKSGPAAIVSGQNASYTIAVTNHGPSPAANVSLADPAPAGLSFVSASAPCAGGFPCNLGTMASGTTVNLTVVFAVPANYAGVSVTNVANATSTTQDPDANNNSSTVVTPTSTSADVEVVKSGPASATAGQNASYTIAVTNHGPSDALAVSLLDPTPAGLNFVSASAPCASGFPCALGTLNAGQTVNITATFAVPPSYSGANISNLASASSTTPDPNSGNNSSTVVTPVTASADIVVAKTGPASVNSGAAIGYTVVVSNAGPSDADGATFSDPVPAGISGVTATCGAATLGAACGTVNVAGNTVTSTITSLPAGSSVTFTIGGTAPFGAQTLINTATSAPPSGVSDTDPANNTSSASTTIGGAADIGLTKNVDNAAPNVGDTVVFTIIATNHGPNDASGVAVTDSLPAGLGFVSATASQGAYVNASGLWTIGNLANGVSVTLTITATVDVPGGLTNTVAVSASDQPDPDTSNNNAGASINSGATADIGIAKSVDNTAPNVGSSVTFTITATNHGPNDATGVEATDHLPAGTSFVGATPSQGTYDDVGGVWTIGALTNGAIATLTITVNVDQPGSITNSVTITHEDQFDPVGANNQAGTTINGQQADLAVTKTVDNATPNVGQNVTFTVSVHNNGPSAATNVALTDQLPAGLTFVSATPSQGTYSNATGVWTVGALGVTGSGSSATLSIVASVTQAGATVNTASVSASDQPDPNTTNNSDSAALNGNPQADLEVGKSGPATVTPGNDAVYTIVVTNHGPSNATNVVVVDATAAGLVFVGNAGACATAYPCSIAAIASGASVTITSTYTVPANYTGANPIINTASATSDTPDPDTTNNQSSAQTNVGPGNADVAIVKSGPATVASGGSIAYTLTISNNGPSPANGASYVDNVPVGITAITASCGGAIGGATCGAPPAVAGSSVSGTVGSLPNGGAVVVTISGTAPSGPVALSNTASVTAPAGINDTDPANNSSTVATSVAALSADVSVVKTGPANAAPGTNVTYTLTVTNAGPDAATNVVLNDATPAGLSFVSASLPCAAGFPCSLGTMPAGGSTIVVVTFAVPANASGSIVNIATAGSDTPDPNPSNNSSTVTTPLVPVTTSADLAVVKSGPASVAAGTNAVYTLLVTNNGPDAATSVVLADPTPAGLTFVSADGPCTGGFPCALGTLANGAGVNVNVTFAVPVNASVSIVNTASVNSATPDPNGSNNSSTVTTTVVPVAAVSADLVVAKIGPATVVAGSTISYTIVVTNDGPDAVPDAVLSDPTPPGLTFVSASAPCAGGFPCTIGAIANGASVTITTSYTVAAGFAGSITNIASAHSTTVPDPTPNNNSSTVGTTVTGAPGGEVKPVPVDARWMLALMTLMLMLVGAPLAKRRR